MDKEYLIFCDESDLKGAFYSNFYGGVMVGSTQYQRIDQLLNDEKRRLNLLGEVKWSKVSGPYLGKYQELMKTFFEEVRHGHLKVRVMFRQNVHQPIGLSQAQLEGTYFRLYYQFVKHGFGLMHRPGPLAPAKLKLFFDEFPETREAATQFKGFIAGLGNNASIRKARLTITLEDVVEIRSHDHVIAQCLDVVLGAMAFRLNDKHTVIPPGELRRGKRTIAKERLYRSVLREIHSIRPGLNIGISTGLTGGVIDRWNAPYLHWSFKPSEMEYRREFTKGKKRAPPNLH